MRSLTTVISFVANSGFAVTVRYASTASPSLLALGDTHVRAALTKITLFRVTRSTRPSSAAICRLATPFFQRAAMVINSTKLPDTVRLVSCHESVRPVTVEKSSLSPK